MVIVKLFGTKCYVQIGSYAIAQASRVKRTTILSVLLYNSFVFKIILFLKIFSHIMHMVAALILTELMVTELRKRNRSNKGHVKYNPKHLELPLNIKISIVTCWDIQSVTRKSNGIVENPHTPTSYLMRDPH